MGAVEPNPPSTSPVISPIALADIQDCFSRGWRDFVAAPLPSLFFANVFVLAGLLMSTITFATGTTYWLVLAVMGFPLLGALTCLGFYELSRNRAAERKVSFGVTLRRVWDHRRGQLPWLAWIVVFIFLFWFFLGHMIFALFLGLAPMTNVSSSLGVFLTSDGLTMLAFGTLVGSVFAVLVFSATVIGMPLVYDRDIDFVTGMLTSIKAVRMQPGLYLLWGALIGAITLIAMVPAFLGLYVAIPVLGHASWHLYRKAIPRTLDASPVGITAVSMPE